MDQEAFERGLEAGAEVIARWTCSHLCYSGVARVVRISSRTYRVRLVEAVGNYPAGHELVIPRHCERGYSPNNRLEAPERGAS